MRIPLGPWEPDSAGVDASVLSIAKNVYATKAGYAPMPSLEAFSTDTLPERCVGMAFARTASGGWLIFAGTRFKLYKLIGGLWTDATRLAGGDYNVPVDDYWSFTQFGSDLIAVNINDDPQKIDVDSGASNFSVLGGSPPRARYVSVVGSFVVLGALSSDPRAVENSALEDAEGWTIGTDLCSLQTFPDGGRVTGVAGGEYGYVLQEKSIRRMIFQSGSDTAFRYERVESEHGGAAGYSIVATVNAIFFLSDDGFYSFNANGLVPIGGQKVNKWFRSNCDTTRFFSVEAFADPFAPRVGWAFYNSAGSTNLDRVIFYDWQLDRWTYAEQEAQYWASITTPGTTLEGLDVYGDIDSGLIPYPFDSRAWEGGAPIIGAVDSSGRPASLEGALPLTALFNFSPLHLIPGFRAKVQSIYPLGVYNGATIQLRVGRRESTSNSPTYTDYTSPSTLSGVTRFNASGRVHDFELTISQTAGTNWAHAQGLDVEAVNVGRK